MNTIYLEEEKERVEFAKRAAKRFADDPTLYTFTDEEIKTGCFFALRYGLGDDCVVVFKISDDEPVNYAQLVRAYINKGFI